MVAVVPQSERDLAKVVFSLRQLSDDFNFVGTWTPVLTFAVPVGQTIVYSAQSGLYMKVGRLLIAKFTITTSTFTHSSTGSLTVTGLPVTSADTDGNSWRCGILRFQGITKANYTQFVPVVVRATKTFNVDASGSAQSVAQVTAADMPSGGSVDLRGMLFYFTDL